MHAILEYKTHVKAADKAINQTRTGVIDARALRASKAIAGSRAPIVPCCHDAPVPGLTSNKYQRLMNQHLPHPLEIPINNADMMIL